MPKVNIQIPEAQDTEWQDLQFRFDGRWMPDVDPMLIGPNNFRTLQNMRYTDAGIQGILGYEHMNQSPITGYDDISDIHQLIATDQSKPSLTLVRGEKSGSAARIYVTDGTPGDEGDTSFNFDEFSGDPVHTLGTGGDTYFEDASADLDGRFSDAPQTSICYCNGEESVIYGGPEQPAAAVFHIDGAAGASDLDFPIDVTSQLKNKLSSTARTDYVVLEQGTKEDLLIMTTRPIGALKFDLTTVTVGNAAIEIYTWTGSAWSADLIDTDGTAAVAGQSLSQDGTITFSSHTVGTSMPYHFEELYLYAYHLHWNPAAGVEVNINNVTVDYAMQDLNDVWDGVYRQPIQFQVLDGATTTYADYTLHVNESSDVNNPIGAIIAGQGSNAADKVYIMFEDRMSAIRFTFLADQVNSVNATMSISYWNGSAFTALTSTDGTKNGVVSASQSGVITWEDPGAAEKARTMFGSFGYVYEIDYNSAGLTAETTIDVCTGTPAQKDVFPCDFSALFGSRLMLGGFSNYAEPNRMDYSVANAPDVWNGFDSSDGGKQSLYFGNSEAIVAATQIYNRFGAAVFAMLLVLKKNRVYILVGETPEDFIIYPVATTVGCVAPKTLATSEIGIDLGQGITRNVAIWISHSGPMMFDGAILTPIDGVSKYFDPSDASYVNFDAIENAYGWVDPYHKEYNVLLPTGSSLVNDLWLVYDLARRKWYIKDTGSSEFPQCGTVLSNPSTAERLVWVGLDNGYYAWEGHETKWDDVDNRSGITQRVITGDFFPSGNIWDETTIRKLAIYIKKLADTTSSHELGIYYYTNTQINPGSGIVFYDSNVSSGIHVDFTDVLSTVTPPIADDNGVSFNAPISSIVDLNLDVGLARILKIIDDQNRTGWAHAFEFSITTNDVEHAFEPVAWGLRYRLTRKNDTDNT